MTVRNEEPTCRTAAPVTPLDFLACCAIVAAAVVLWRLIGGETGFCVGVGSGSAMGLVQQYARFRRGAGL